MMRYKGVYSNDKDWNHETHERHEKKHPRIRVTLAPQTAENKSFLGHG
jgi:hypothetical protein